jgi:signal transduction histidine kinase
VRREDPEQLPVVFADREQTLVSSIAYLERLAAHYARLSPVADAGPCDLAAVIAEVAAAARNITAVEVSTEIEPVPLVGAGSVALRRILENLVSNALDSLGSGSGRIRLTLRAVQSTPPVVCLMVSDTGMGMDAEGLARAFNDFYTSKSEGIGLGLSVVRRLVLDMNGDVRIESTPGVGTTVVLHLPVAVLASTPPPEAGRLAS